MIKTPAIRVSVGLILGFVLSIGPARSAVRDCGGSIADSGEGRTEEEARTKALDGWTKQVETLGGMEHAQWRVAAERSFECERTADAYRCHARARPCVIKQVAPKGWTPAKRRDVLIDR